MMTRQVENEVVRVRPRRSVLWVPGDQPAKLAKAAKAGADVVVLDLEDGVAPHRKAAARESVAGALRDLDFGRTERMVRVNGGTLDPLDVEAATLADGLCLPKADTPAQLHALRLASEMCTGRVLPILAISAETPRGVISSAALVEASEAVVAWMWGSEDLAAVLGVHARQAGEPFVGPLEFARNVTTHLAAATGAQAIDTVYPFFRDHDGLLEEARAAAAAGYAGKGIIHPAQIGPCHEAFTPSDDEVAHARGVVDAFVGGAGVVALDGQMLDLPHLRAAERTLSRAGALSSTSHGGGLR